MCLVCDVYHTYTLVRVLIFIFALLFKLSTKRDRQSEDDLSVPLLYNPCIPILFLTNESELGPVEQYIKRAKDTDDAITPAMWTVSRPGHNWTNEYERLSAIEGLISWLEFGTFITARLRDNTKYSLCLPSSVHFDDVKRPTYGQGKVV